MEHLIVMHIIWTRPSFLNSSSFTSLLAFARFSLAFSSSFLSNNSIHFDFISIFCMIFSPHRRLNWKNEKLIRHRTRSLPGAFLISKAFSRRDKQADCQIFDASFQRNNLSANLKRKSAGMPSRKRPSHKSAVCPQPIC